MSFPFSQLVLENQRGKEGKELSRCQVWSLEDSALCWEPAEGFALQGDAALRDGLTVLSPVIVSESAASQNLPALGPFSLNEKQVGAGVCFRHERRHSSVSHAREIIHEPHLLSWELFPASNPALFSLNAELTVAKAKNQPSKQRETANPGGQSKEELPLPLPSARHRL